MSEAESKLHSNLKQYIWQSVRQSAATFDQIVLWVTNINSHITRTQISDCLDELIQEKRIQCHSDLTGQGQDYFTTYKPTSTESKKIIFHAGEMQRLSQAHDLIMEAEASYRGQQGWEEVDSELRAVREHINKAYTKIALKSGIRR